MYLFKKKHNSTDNENVKTEKIEEIFLEPVEFSKPIVPYYINTDRLTDLHAIINGGYTDSVEWSQTTVENVTNNKNGKINAGFKLFKIFESSASASSSKEDVHSMHTEQRAKLVHTAASMLQNILDNNFVEKPQEYDKKELVHAHNGNWLFMNVTLHKPESPVNEVTIEKGKTYSQRKWFKNLKKAYQSLNGIPNRAPVELKILNVYSKTKRLQEDKISTDVMLSKDYLYQCELDDLWGVELICLGKFLTTENGSRVEIVALFQ